VDVADRRRREWLALVRDAALGALMRLGDAVLDRSPAQAAAPAPAQLAVERIQGLGVELTDLDVSEARRDVVADMRAAEIQRGRRSVELVQVAIEELVDGRARARATLLRNLIERLASGGLSLTLRLRSHLDDLFEVVPAARHGVDARVHGDP
jgi:hypothetical protein